MKLIDLLAFHADHAEREGRALQPQGWDTPVPGSLRQTFRVPGTLHLSTWHLSNETSRPALTLEDVPITIIPSLADIEPTEGLVLGRDGDDALVQTFDAPTPGSATIVPDTLAFYGAVVTRLRDMANKPESFALGPAERLLPWLDPERASDDARGPIALSLAAFQTIWLDTATERRAALATAAADLARANKRVLLVTGSHRAADDMTGIVGRVLRAAGLTYKSVLSRYELATRSEAAEMPLTELGFEAQMHQFYAQSRADKATLRRKYERFRELSPLLAYKAEKQKDLDEVKLLEWRLVTQITELQDKVTAIDTTLAEYDALPIWKRLAMQTVGKNVASLQDYRLLYAEQIVKLKAEVDVAKARIAVLAPEAAIPKDMRPEYEELKEEIVALGGTKKIRELLAAEEGTNRQAFIQNKRIVVTTAARVATDPLFRRVRFDALLVDDATDIPGPLLLAAAGLAREKLILAGNPTRIPTPNEWSKILKD